MQLMAVGERGTAEYTAWGDTCCCGRKRSLPFLIKGRMADGPAAGREFTDCWEDSLYHHHLTFSHVSLGFK